jgi:Transposase
MSEYAGRQFVGIDLHRRRTVLVRTSECGEVLEATRILNDVDSLNAVMARAGGDAEVVLEATYGWYWAVDALRAAGARVHLAHPLGVKAFEYRRVKNDFRDAADLADLLRMGRLPEAWIAPPATRELRELVRHRAKLVGLRSGCKAEVHAVLAKCGIAVPMSDLFSPAGEELLERINLPAPYGARVQSLQRLIEDLEDEIDLFARLARGKLVARSRLRRGPAAARGGADPGCGVPRRGRRCCPVRQGRAAGLLGRPDAQASRVRHPCASGPDHQAGLPAGAVGRGGVGQADRLAHRGRRLQTPGRGPAREERRHRGRGSQADRVRLLRAARPPCPCPVPAG